MATAGGRCVPDHFSPFFIMKSIVAYFVFLMNYFRVEISLDKKAYFQKIIRPLRILLFLNLEHPLDKPRSHPAQRVAATTMPGPDSTLVAMEAHYIR